jgi:serine/threonine-protein kinase
MVAPSPTLGAGLSAGDVLVGKYRIERVLGAGGMGVVLAARHLQLDEMVAIKVLRESAAQGSEAVQRFLREARAAVKIRSDHVARVSDVGELPDGSPYMVMEYLEGTDLAGWLRDRGPLPTEQAVDFVLQACEAIAEAHALGIVHRDLKPHNLFCLKRPDGRLSIKVLDFGISKLTAPRADSHDMTRTTAVMGSPLYMSPEQMHRSKNVDARTDIWALGVILYELVAGRPPFVADAITELAIMIATQPAPTLAQAGRAAPRALERVIERCLEKDVAHRFQNVGDLAAALGPVGTPRAAMSVEAVLGTLRRAGIAISDDESGGVAPAPAAQTAPPAGPLVSGVAPHTGAAWGQTPSGATGRKRSRPGIVIAMVIATLVVGVGLATLGVRLIQGKDGGSGAAAERASSAEQARSGDIVHAAVATPASATAATSTVPAAPVDTTSPPAHAALRAGGNAAPAPSRGAPAASAPPSPAPPPATKPPITSGAPTIERSFN